MIYTIRKTYNQYRERDVYFLRSEDGRVGRFYNSKEQLYEFVINKLDKTKITINDNVISDPVFTKEYFEKNNKK